MKHAEQENLWATAKAWGLPLKMTDTVIACQQCSVCMDWHPCPLQETTEQIKQGEYISPLPLLEETQYALTYVDTTMGLMQAFPSKRVDQRQQYRAYRNYCLCMVLCMLLKVINEPILQDIMCNTWLRFMTLDGTALPLYPTESGLIEHYNRLLKNSLNTEEGSL